MSTTDAVRRQSTKYGLLVILGGLLSFIALRVWTSPLVLSMTGRPHNGLLEFLLIPALMVVVGVGVALFLWEPDEGR